MSLCLLLSLLLPLPFFAFCPQSPLSSSSSILPIITYTLGLLTPAFFRQIVRIWQRVALRKSSNEDSVQFSEGTARGLYGLDHAILNVELRPPDKMWMNMGYWKKATELPEACEALVDRILQFAGLVSNHTTEDDKHLCLQNADANKRRRVLLDLGFGCGEQTLYLMNRRASRNIGSEAYPSDDKPASIFQHYVGITLDRTQYEFATSRVISSGQDNGERKDFSAQSAKPRPHTSETIQLFCGDAANPSSWPKELQQAVSIAFSQEKSQYSSHAPEPERYVLALDSAYHFQPSRRPIFKYTHSVLHAHFLAFDIFLAPASSSRLRSFVNNFALRVLTPSLSAPFSNFVPPSAYKTQLRDAGYAEEDIAIEDITDDVFPGLARFLERRDQQLAALGLSGFLKWRISGWLFRWLSAGDILRAGIVVAKWKEKGLK